MDVNAGRASDDGRQPKTGSTTDTDFSFLPNSLISQCQVLIESFHDLHGYSCLPDILWKTGFGPFIEAHEPLRQLLRKASTTRSAKKSNAGFVRIATAILSLEILASRFAGWSNLYPREATRSRNILSATTRGLQNQLIEFYLYPPKHLNSAAIATLAPPSNLNASDIYGVPMGETGQETAIGYQDAT